MSTLCGLSSRLAFWPLSMEFGQYAAFWQPMPAMRKCKRLQQPFRRRQRISEPPIPNHCYCRRRDCGAGGLFPWPESRTRFRNWCHAFRFGRLCWHAGFGARQCPHHTNREHKPCGRSFHGFQIRCCNRYAGCRSGLIVGCGLLRHSG